jgi:paraquat-inducible protein A
MRLIACPDCDLLQDAPVVPIGARASCSRCGGLLRKRPPNSAERTLALAIAAAVLFAVAQTFPFLSFEMKGRITTTTLMTGILDLYRGGKFEIALLVLVTTVLAPLAQLMLFLYLLLPLQLGWRPWQLPVAFRLLRHAQTWSMMEVFLIGILVAITKLMGMADIVPGVALWSFALLMVVISAAVVSFDPDWIWERVEALA